MPKLTAPPAARLPADTPADRGIAIEEVVAEILCCVGARFADLGADSLDVIEITLAIEDALGRSLDLDEVGDLHTVGELVAAVERDWVK
jgi:acyl carrier protein